MSEFVSFIQQLKRLNFPLDLPGEEAQYLMVPSIRPRKSNLVKELSDFKESAVAILFYPLNDKPYFVLIHRTNDGGKHSGQISFPGGKRDLIDEDLFATASRELNEEIGIDLKLVNRIGELTNIYIPVSKFMVQPVVMYSNHRPLFVPSESEVQRVLEIPVELLLDETVVKSKEMELSYNNSTMVPYFDLHGHVVWGATAMMLSELKQLLIKLA